MKTEHSKQSDGAPSFAERFGQRVIRWRWPVLLASLLLVMGMGYGGQYLAFNGDYHIFFSKDNPQLNAFDALQEKYSKDDNVLIAVEPKDGDVFTPETLAALEALTKAAWQTPYSSRVDGITNFQHTRAVEDDLYVDDLVENALEKSPSELAKIKEIATKEPNLVHRLVDEDGTIAAINITVKLPGESQTEEDEITAYVRNMLVDFEAQNPGLKTYASGIVMMTAAFKEAASGDMMTLIPTMFLIIIVTIFLATRSFTATISTLLIVMLSIMVAMGFGGWMGMDLTPPTASVPTIVLTLAIADSIHILISMMQNIRAGMNKNTAIVQSLKVNFMPVMITSLTTVIGFLTMNFSDAPPFRELGNMTAIGMIGAFLFSTTTLPALMSILPVRPISFGRAGSGGVAWIDRFANWVVARHRPVLWLSSFAIVGISLFAIQNEMNDEFVKYFSSNITFRADTDHISERLTGIYNTEFSLKAGESGGINNPDYLAKLEEFEGWLKSQEEVVHVNTFSEVAKRVNKSMHGDTLSYYQVPSNRDEAAQFLLLYEMSLPFGLDLNNQINVDKSESRFTVTLENISSNELIAFNEKAENWLSTNAPEAMFDNGTSTTTMFAHLGKRQMKSMISGTALGLILITIVLMFALGSFKYGMLSLIPNITPITVGFGLWAVSIGMVNTGIAIVFGMTLGIIVDDTVHFISKYLRARREQGKTAQEAVKYAFSTVGRALVSTTIVLVAGFFVLAQSQFAMNSGMARITALIISLALIIDFLLLPALLIVLGDAEEKEKPAAITKEALVAEVKY